MNTKPNNQELSGKEQFSLQGVGNRIVPFNAEPVEALPELGGVAHAEGIKLVLHPPLDFELAYRVPQYLIFTPYARAVLDLSIDDAPARRQTWSAGSAFVAPPDTTVRARMLEPVEFLCIIVDAEKAEAVFERVAAGRSWAPDVITNLSDPGFAIIQHEVRRSLLGDPLVEPAYLGALADAALARIGCQYSGMPLTTHGRETLAPATLRRIIEHIEEYLGDKIVVEDLAKAAGLSRSHFSRAFQNETGEAPQDFIISRRLSRARELLSDSDRSIAAIAAATGFSSQAHLSTVFKKRIGTTPARYRASFGKEQ
ncbi:MAG: helix-turn-helix domain-containing protein [Pseudomonadota bacterium]